MFVDLAWGLFWVGFCECSLLGWLLLGLVWGFSCSLFALVCFWRGFSGVLFVGLAFWFDFFWLVGFCLIFFPLSLGKVEAVRGENDQTQKLKLFC